MAARRRGQPPRWDAIEHVVKALDKTAELEVEYINSFKGRGVFAKAHFQKGDFVVEYRGELISSEESQRRKSIYHPRCTVFMFDFCWRGRAWCVDAAQEDGSLGRLVNDDHYYPNCRMKKIATNCKPHLVLFARKDINAGEEITYDYVGTDLPWRKQVWVAKEGSKKGDWRGFSAEQQPPGRAGSQQTPGSSSSSRRAVPDHSKLLVPVVAAAAVVPGHAAAKPGFRQQPPGRAWQQQLPGSAGPQTTVAESSAAEISRTEEEAPQRSTFF